MKKIVLKHWPVILLVIIWFIFAYPYFLKGLVPFPSKYLVTFFPPWNSTHGMPVKNAAMPDVITQMYPWKKITIDSWKLGQIPRWNPYQFSGTPLLANAQSAVWTPLNLLFFVLPFIDAWSILILLQPLLGAVGMFLFLRSVRVSRPGSVLGSLSFMFCGFETVWMAYGTLGYAALSLPWVLYGLTQWIQTHKRSFAIITVGSIVFSFVSGHLQTSLYVMGAAFVYVLFIGITSRKWKDALGGVVLLGIGVVIALPQLIPTMKFYSQTVRSGLFGKIEVIPWNYLITILAPDILGNPVTRNDWFGHYAEWASYAGIAPLMLALFVLLVRTKKPRIIWYFAALAAIALIVAFPTPVEDLLVNLRIPVFSNSAQSRIIVLLSFAIASLGALGLDVVAAMSKQHEGRKFFILYSLIWILALGFLWMQLFFGNLVFLPSVGGEKLSVAQHNFMLPTLVVIATCAILIFMTFSKRIRGQLLLMLLVALTAFDMLRFAMKWMPFDPRQYVYPTEPVLQYLSIHAGYERVFGNFGNEGQSPFGLFGIEGYDPLYIRRYGEFITSAGDGKVGMLARYTVLLGKQGRNTKKILDMLAVRYLVHATGDGRNVWAFPFWNYPDSFGAPVYSDEHYEVYENNNAFDRAYFVKKFIVAHSDGEILDILFNDTTNLRSVAVLEENPTGFTPSNTDIFERIRIRSYTPNEVTIDVQTNQPGILLLADSYYPGWSAYVNSAKTKIYRANYSQRAIVVPEGSSTVRFVYDHWFL